MNPLLSVSLWLTLSVFVCCENSGEEDWDRNDLTDFNWTDYIDSNWTSYNDFNLTGPIDFNWTSYNDFNLTDSIDFNFTDLDDYTEVSTDLVHTSFKEAESNFRNKASGIGQLKLVFLLGLAVLQIWN